MGKETHFLARIYWANKRYNPEIQSIVNDCKIVGVNKVLTLIIKTTTNGIPKIRE